MQSGVPIIRDLRRCRRSDFSEASKEVIAAFVWALVPVWLGAFVLSLIPVVSASHYVYDFFVSGEAMLVSTALMGPNIYMITKKYGGFRGFSVHFPQAWFLSIVTFVICMITAAIFGTQRVYAQLNPGKPQPQDPVTMFWVSLALCIITVAALYLVTVFKNFAEAGASAEMHSETDDFVKEFQAATKPKGRRR